MRRELEREDTIEQLFNVLEEIGQSPTKQSKKRRSSSKLRKFSTKKRSSRRSRNDSKRNLAYVHDESMEMSALLDYMERYVEHTHTTDKLTTDDTNSTTVVQIEQDEIFSYFDAYLQSQTEATSTPRDSMKGRKSKKPVAETVIALDERDAETDQKPKRESMKSRSDKKVAKKTPKALPSTQPQTVSQKQLKTVSKDGTKREPRTDPKPESRRASLDDVMLICAAEDMLNAEQAFDAVLRCINETGVTTQQKNKDVIMAALLMLYCDMDLAHTYYTKLCKSKQFRQDLGRESREYIEMLRKLM